jgi:hypothetical protein
MQTKSTTIRMRTSSVIAYSGCLRPAVIYLAAAFRAAYRANNGIAADKQKPNNI